MVTYLRDGQYLNNELTESVTAEMLVYNPVLSVFGLWRGNFVWDTKGFITLKQDIKVCRVQSLTCWLNRQALFTTSWRLQLTPEPRQRGWLDIPPLV
jgi:hypothetical protein